MRIIILWLISLKLLLHGSNAVSLSLKDGWSLINHNGSIEVHNISIPSGVYSALEEAKLQESVLFSDNDVKLRWIAMDNWTYSLNFTIDQEDLVHNFVILTFKGLDTLATISLNGRGVGSVSNMFVRYRFNVKSILVEGMNELSVEFQSPVEGANKINANMGKSIPPNCPPSMYHGECHMNLLRKMQASFAWDWGLAAPSMGIWRNAFLEVYDSILIRDITYQLVGGSLEEESDEDVWTLKIFVHMETGLKKVSFEGVMTSELIDVQDSISYHKIGVDSDKLGEFTAEISMSVNKSSVNRWWPNGYGSQSLYGLQIKWEDAKINEVSNRDRRFYVASKTINIGFRTVELIQEPMNNGLSFYFKVNDIPMFMKGSNWIPSHILPEKTFTKEKIKELLLATRDANMNMLRVWGGGLYESDYFYSLADEYGILIWQDMMFACAMYPAKKEFLDSVRMEVKHQVRRIQHHPSIALFATNNENEVAIRQNWYGTNSRFLDFAKDYRTLYVETVTEEIKRNNPTSIVLTSSPSNGNHIDTENGIGNDPQNPHYGDIHFYIVDHNAWKPENFHQPRFSSEYGFQSFPSGWRSVMRENDTMSSLVDHRQHHPMKSKPISFLVEENVKVKFDFLPWDDKIYLSQLSQAMAMKTETEVYRSGRGTFMNTMGALYWQLNDVWVAPSWSSIEYNGNFKMVHHWMKQIFAQHTIVTQMTLLKKLQIYVISDEINVESKPVIVRMNVRRWDDFRVINTLDWDIEMKPNDATTLAEEFDIIDYMAHNRYNVSQHMLEFTLIDNQITQPFGNDEITLSTNFMFPADFKELSSVGNPKPELRITLNKCDNGLHKISLEVKIQSPAIFMSVSLNHDTIEKYQISKNGFMQFEPIQALQVTFLNPNCSQTISSADFVVKTLNQFLL